MPILSTAIAPALLTEFTVLTRSSTLPLIITVTTKDQGLKRRIIRSIGVVALYAVVMIVIIQRPPAILVMPSLVCSGRETHG